MTSTDMPDEADVARDHSVGTLAAHVISVLSNRTGRSLGAGGEALHRDLRAAVLTKEVFSVDQVLEDLSVRDVSAKDLIDVFIPDVARDLGACWEASSMSFATVSVGSARLQSLLPRLERSILGGDTFNALIKNNKSILVAGPIDDHTLGASVLASQLRRLGYDTRLMFLRDLDAAERADFSKAASQSDLILFSCAYAGSLRFVRAAVDHLKTQHGTRLPPTALGGPVLDHAQDIQAMTGVGLVTNDIFSAIKLMPNGPVPSSSKKEGINQE